MYKRVKKWNNIFKISMIIIIILTAILIINKLTNDNIIITNIFGILAFIMMFFLAYCISNIVNATSVDIKENAKIFDNILLTKYCGDIRCESQINSFSEDSKNNILLKGNIVKYDYRIYGTINNKNIECMQNFKVYYETIEYRDGHRRPEAHYLLYGHCLKYSTNKYLGYDVIIKSATYKKIIDSKYKKAGYKQISDTSDENIIYIHNDSIPPDINSLRQEYLKVINATKSYFKVEELLIMIKNGEIQVYIQKLPENDMLLKEHDSGMLKPNELDIIVDIFKQLIKE